MSLNPFVVAERTITTLSIALASGAAKGATTLLPSDGGGFMSAAALVVGVPALTVLIKAGTTKIFNKSRFLRQLVWGKHDIEGCWIDCVRSGSTVVSIGLTEFFVKDFVVHWRGHNYTADGRPTSAYEAVAVNVTWPITKFWYATHPSEGRGNQDEGICELNFPAPNSNAPNLYLGWACDTGTSKVVSLRGKRVRDKDILDKLSDATTQIPTLLQLASDLATSAAPADPRATLQMP